MGSSRLPIGVRVKKMPKTRSSGKIIGTSMIWTTILRRTCGQNSWRTANETAGLDEDEGVQVTTTLDKKCHFIQKTAIRSCHFLDRDSGKFPSPFVIVLYSCFPDELGPKFYG